MQRCFLGDDHFSSWRRTEFAALVLGTRPDHFVPSQPAAAGERIAAGELAAAYVVAMVAGLAGRSPGADDAGANGGPIVRRRASSDLKD
ncbi:hypothetical protein Nham_3763 [Nitrobacter hamburgensis X14]|uniref:Uncharacterized protein n=1 Tax=Nitrobacter hamburgensis (strain DSM 10229 / NCIMB 13809 / X14) TaxID=323097 RepID=Q1QH11_NITHX|nr:hypothetical protein [Nitrobacter hamburgensis]ABE64486.1 hypothetical protein Nham_3763 [Nitrobacter hamburgensis X14]